MRAVEVTGTIDRQGHMLLDQPFDADISSRVRVIVLFSESTENLEIDPDDTPVEKIKASLKRAFQQVKTGQIPHSLQIEVFHYIAILNELWKYKAYNKGLKPLVSPQMI